MACFGSAGITLAYDDTGDAGSGDGSDQVPLVLLHGLSSSRSTWDELVLTLAPRYRVLTMDLRGHGESDHAPGTYTLENYVPDAIELCEQLDEPAALVGHSLGGVIAATVAQARPDLVRGVFLEDPPFGDVANLAGSPLRLMFSLMRDMVSTMRDRQAPIEEYIVMLHAAPALNGVGTMADTFGEAGTNAQARALANLDPETIGAALDGTALATAQPGKPVTCPVHVVRADPTMEPLFTAEDEAKFLKTNPHSGTTTMHGASHLIHDEQPDRFLAELTTFLARVP